MMSAAPLPHPDHIVVVIMEDHSYQQVLGKPTYAQMLTWWVKPPQMQFQAPYLRSLAGQSAVFTNARATAHANQTDYQALFSGIAPQAHPDAPLIQNQASNIATELLAAGKTFGGYAEGLPRVGWDKGGHGDYAQTHNPWVAQKNVPASVNLPFSQFPANYNNLPTVSYVVPNQIHNMHSDSVLNGDKWLGSHINGYAKWARRHNSLLVITWDESHTPNDNIPTLFFGPMVKPGQYGEPVDHYSILNTVEQMAGVAPTNLAANATPITDVFRSA